MKIMFDLLYAQPIGNSKFHGGGEYIKSVFHYLVENYNDRAEICVFYDAQRFLDDWIKKLLEKYKIASFDVKGLETIPQLLQKEKVDIFYSGLAYAYSDVILPKDIRKIGTIHGLRTLEEPCDELTADYNESGVIRYVKSKLKWKLTSKDENLFQKKEIRKFERIISNFDTIVTVSNHTKYAIQSWFNDVPAEKIRVYYTPAKYVEGSVSENVESQKYILLIGGNRWIKNSARSIAALEKLFDKKQLDGYSVIVCGKPPKFILKNIRNTERYQFLDYVKPEKLEALYKNCEFFLYLSLNEGFGMPPLEAMNYGKTVIASPICSIPEVCGDAVYYANPYDIKEIQNRILQATDNKIDTSKIREHFSCVKNKQEKDLAALCDYIVGGSKA